MTGAIFLVEVLCDWIDVQGFAWNIFEYDIFGLTSAPAQHAEFFVTEVTGPTFWVGLPNSAFGPEVGVLGVLAMLLCVGLFWLLRRQQ